MTTDISWPIKIAQKTIFGKTAIHFLKIKTLNYEKANVMKLSKLLNIKISRTFKNKHNNFQRKNTETGHNLQFFFHKTHALG